MSKLERVRTSSRELERVQDNVDRALSHTGEKTIIPNVSLSHLSTNRISHTLGRKLIGWNTSRLRGNSIIWDSQDNNLSPDKTLFLECSVDVIADIEVY